MEPHRVDAEPPEDPAPDPSTYAKKLRRIRFRRLLLWGVLILYFPFVVAILVATGSLRTAVGGFGLWFVLFFFVALASGAARCPRCGEYFHVNGPVLLYRRRCLHCGLHVSADK